MSEEMIEQRTNSTRPFSADFGTLLPAQWARNAPTGPEVALAMACLVVAVADLERPRLRDEAAAWIAGTPVAPGCWSFETVCGLLGMETGYVRRIISRKTGFTGAKQIRHKPNTSDVKGLSA